MATMVPSGSARTLTELGVHIPQFAQSLPALFDVTHAPPRGPTKNWSSIITQFTPNSGDGTTGLSIFMITGKSHTARIYRDRDYHKHWQPTDIMFVRRIESPNHRKVDVPRPWLELGQMNEVMRRGYIQAMSKVERITIDGLVSGSGDPDATGRYGSFRQLVSNDMVGDDEGTWFSGTERQRIHNFDAEQDVRYLSKEGCLSMWLYGGVMIAYNDVASVPIHTCAYTGPIDVREYWGSEAKMGKHLFIVLKRLYNKTTGTFAQFAWVPMTSTTLIPPAHRLQYRDLSGRVQYGHVVYIGYVTDTEFPATPLMQRIQAASLSNDVTPNDRQKARTGMSPIKIELGPPPAHKGTVMA